VDFKVTAEQSYAYYIGSNGTDKDPQVAQLFNRYNLIYLAIILMCVWTILIYFYKASGAYVFRPDGVLPIKSKEEVIHISCIYNLISRQYVKTQKKN